MRLFKIREQNETQIFIHLLVCMLCAVWFKGAIFVHRFFRWIHGQRLHVAVDSSWERKPRFVLYKYLKSLTDRLMLPQRNTCSRMQVTFFAVINLKDKCAIPDCHLSCIMKHKYPYNPTASWSPDLYSRPIVFAHITDNAVLTKVNGKKFWRQLKWSRSAINFYTICLHSA